MNESKYSRYRAVLSGFLSGVFALAGICAVSAVIILCVVFSNQKPVLISVPDSAIQNVTSMMDAVCSGNFNVAGNYILGSSDFGVDRAPQDPVGALIWEAYLDSMDYQLAGNCYTTEAGLAQNVTFTCMDISSVVSTLRERSQSMLEARVESAASVSDIYDENNEYRADVVNEVLLAAATDAIREDGRIISIELVIHLRYQDGSWWIVADQSLINALFGNILY